MIVGEGQKNFQEIIATNNIVVRHCAPDIAETDLKSNVQSSNMDERIDLGELYPTIPFRTTQTE